MEKTCNISCDRIALACVLVALLISASNLVLWHQDPFFLLSLSPGGPVMVPNVTLGLGLAALLLLAIRNDGESLFARGLQLATGTLLAWAGVASLAEHITGTRLAINHFYFDHFLTPTWRLMIPMSAPSAPSGVIFLLIGGSFLLWRRHYRVAQLLLFANLALNATALLGHFYEVPSLYRLPWEEPLSGISTQTALAALFLTFAMLFSRWQESVVRLAFAPNPSGTVITRFGLGAVVSLTGFGACALLKFLLDASWLPLLKVSVSTIFGVGLVLLIWSIVRELDRLERERRRAILELEQSREQLLFSQRLARVAYWQWNLLTDEICASDEFYRLLDTAKPAGRITFTSLLGMVHPEDRRRLTEAAYGAIAGHRFFTADYRVFRQGGEIAHIHSQGRVELDEKGLPWRLRGASLDVTELKCAEVSARQAEERVRVLLDKANEAVRVREDVLSIVSHDLKNPLTSANLGVQLLLRQLGTQPDRAPLTRTASNIQRSLDNMKSLIQGILDVGKIQSGTFAIEPSAVDPREVLKAVYDVMVPIARDREISFEVESAPGVFVLGDRGRLEQVLLNLVGNALKFTQPGGRVRVACERDTERLIFLVEDNGPGIPPQHARHVFERNWQAPSTASGGNGLGLFIAKGIVEAHHGHIWLESEPGRGCRFRFSVPEDASERVLDRKAAEQVEAAHVDVAGGARVHVAEPVAVAPLQLQSQMFRKVEIEPQAGHA